MEGRHLQACEGLEAVEMIKRSNKLVIIVKRFKHNGFNSMDTEKRVDRADGPTTKFVHRIEATFTERNLNQLSTRNNRYKSRTECV